MPQTCRRRYPARRRLGFAVSTGRVIASDRSRFFSGDIDAWLPSTAIRALGDAAASTGDLCGFVPSIKFEDAGFAEYALVRHLRRFWFRHGGHRAGSKIIKDEEADGRRQIALL